MGDTRPVRRGAGGGSVRPASAGAETAVVEAKERFMTHEPIPRGSVRDTIMASWVRSKDWDVPSDNLELPFETDQDRESLLASTAKAAVDEFAAQLADEPVSVVLTDASGVVLDRRSGDGSLLGKLDQVRLAPGFSYAEEHAGTNGIGTALEARAPVHVFGHEHYVEHLEDLACAGTPIRHPITGKVLGLIDLTCWREDANQLMATMSAALARQIEDAVAEAVGRREYTLLQRYLAACRRRSGPVLAVAPDLVMMNDVARERLAPGDQQALIAVAAELLAGGRERSMTTSLPSGATARVQGRPTFADGAAAGGVLQVTLGVPVPGATSPVTTRTVPADAPGPAGSVGSAGTAGAGTSAGGGTPSRSLPGTAGSSPAWLRSVHEVAARFDAGEWLDLYGEVGTGKTLLARSTHLGRTPAEHLRVLDAERGDDGEHLVREAAAELDRESGTVILRHVDRLPVPALAELSTLLEAARTRPGPRPWVVATRSATERDRHPLDRRGGRGSGADGDAGPDAGDALAQVVGAFAYSVEVPPLRRRAEDVPELVELRIGQLTRVSGLRCSPEAMRVLMRNPWPGNVEQLFDALRKVVAHRRTGVIGVSDLPSECFSTSRRLLTPLESIERDAIVDALISTGGNRTEAARHLGLSRATIYRKIRDFGISVPRP